MDTLNPVLIMVINMTIVFAVLYVLGLLIKVIHIIDPTRKRVPKTKSSKLKSTSGKQSVREAVKPVSQDDMADKTLAAIIVTALNAYGCKNFEIKSVRKL